MNIYSENFDRMDSQHKRLGELVDTVCHTLKKEHASDDYSSDELSGVLTRLLDFTSFHFTEEENLMRRYASERLESHQLTHRFLMDRFMELERETFIFDKKTKARLLNFLEKDFYYHIVEDQYAWKTGKTQK